MSDDNQFYSYGRLDATGALYRIVFGERSDGKTYGALMKVLTNYVDNGKQGAYIRRYNEDFTGKRGQQLFASIVSNNEISKLTNGEYNSVSYYSSKWYLSHLNGDNKPIRDTTPFMFGFSLNDMEHDKSTSYPEITTVVFDEFLSKKFYLNNEFVIFENVLSTIIRHRNDVTIYMLGNTVDRFCPYFQEMGLTRAKYMEKGELEIYEYGTSGLKVAIEYAPELDKEVKQSNVYFAFDNPALCMITEGGWELDLYPHLEYKILPKNIKLIYFIEFDNELLQAEVVKDENGLYTFIHRKTTEIKNKKDILFSTKIDASPYHYRRITKPNNEKTKLIYDLIKSEKVFFQDNTVGNTVQNYLNWCSKQSMFQL